MESLSPIRWAGVGRSSAPDAATAGSTAAIAALEGRDAALTVVFASERYDLQALVDAICDCTGDAPLVGCSTSGEIATDGPGDASVVVLALGGSGFSIATTAVSNASTDLRAAGAAAASRVNEVEERPNRILLLLTDALAGNQQDILRGAYATVGAAVPLVGGCAGDDLKMVRTYQLHGRTVLTDAVVSAAIGSEGSLGIGVRHGWVPVDEPMLVTRSAGHIVYELDGKPALDAYLELLGAPQAARMDPLEFTQFALIHPIGLARRTGEPHVRFVGEADFENRSLVCIAAVPEGSIAWLMEGDETSVLHATDAACDAALSAMPPDTAPLAVIAFDCIARRGVLQDEGIQREIDRIATHAGGAPVAGFYTYGEIARTEGIDGFHNETLVVLAIG